jgi:purine-binding chemotaxis protein CheW
MAEKTAVIEKQLVVFNLGKEAYAIEIAIVREIIHMQAITHVPGMPDSVEGVINLRGSVIPIVDLRTRFRLEKIEKDKDTRIIVVSCKGQDVGIIVDAVTQVLRIPVDSIEPSAKLFSEEHLDHLLGVVKLTDSLIILLDIDQVLSRQEVAGINSADLMRKAEEEEAEKDTNKAAVPA